MKIITLLLTLLTTSLGFSQVSLPINFDSTNVNYNNVSFGGNSDSIVSDPAGGTNMVLRAIKSNTAQLWAGTTMGDSGLANAIPFATNANTMSVRVYSPDSGIPIRLKVEDASDPTKSVETEATTSVSNSWETLNFDFSNQAMGTAAINYTYTYDKVSIFFNFGTDGATAGTKTYYCDDVQFGASSGGGGLAKVDLPIRFDSTNVNYDLISFGGNSDTIVTDPAGGSNMVMSATKSNTAQLWAGTTMGDGGLASAIPFASNSNTMTVRVYSPDSGVPVRLKVEDASNGTISVETEDTTTVSNGWETLTFDFSNHISGTSAINYANTYDKVSIFFNFGTTGATAGTKTYYADDVQFVTAGGGGGMLSQVDLPIRFDSTNVNYDVVSFGGNTDTIIADPAGGSNMVMRATKSNTAQSWSGATLGNGGLATAIPFAANANTMTVRVYSPDSGIPVRLKVENASDPSISVETEVNTTVANAWDTLTFDFSQQVTGTSAIRYANTYNMVTIFFNFGTDGATAGTKIYYCDDVEFAGGAGGGGGGSMAQVDLPVRFDSTNVNYDLVSFGGNIDTIVTDPAGGNNKVMRATKPNTAQLWAGTTIGGSGLASAIPFTSNANTMSVRVWSPDSGIPVRLKVEDATDPTISVETEAMTTVANAWDTLTFDFSNQAAGTAAINYASTYDLASIFFNFGTDGATAGTKVYYCDDLVFGGIAGGGGGGGTQLNQVDLPISFDSTNVVDYALVSFGGNADSIAGDPTGGSNQVFMATKTAGAQTWAGTTMGGNGLANPVPFTANDNMMTVDVYSPAAGTPILLKVEDATDGTISVETFDTTTVANAWETLTFDFTKNASGTPAIDYANTYDKVSIFFNFGVSPTADEVYYADDVSFGGPVGLVEQGLNTFSLSPNPSNGVLYLSGNLIQEGAAKVAVRNVQGQLMMQHNQNAGQNEIQLDLSSLQSGIYFITVQGERTMHTEKLVLKP